MQANSPGQDEQQPIPRQLFEALDGPLGSRRSAQQVVPLLLDLLQPRSVVDVGCGVGSWAAVFLELGVSDVLGIDVDYIDRSLLQIPEQCYYPADLKQPLDLDRTFDLVVCLEVASYCAEELAATLVQSLVRLGPVILFSSAIPYQNMEGLMLNQQWPHYWVELFQAHHYTVIDCLRKKFWDNETMPYWFKQNMLLFVQQDYLAGNDRLQAELARSEPELLDLVHPGCYLKKCYRLQAPASPPSIKSLLAELPPAILRAIKRRLG